MDLRRIWLSALLLSALSLPSPAAEDTGQTLARSAAAPLQGRTIPPLVLTTIDGDALDLGALRGRKALYLEFWATWCTPCREQMPHLKAVQRSAGHDLQVVAVNIGFDDTPAQVAAYRAEHGLRMPVVRDGDGRLGALFGLRVTPQHVVVGKDGRILHVGHRADSKLDDALASARSQPAMPAGGSVGKVVGTGDDRLRAGDRAPTRRLRTLEGFEVALADPTHRRDTVLVFLSPWCESYFAVTRPASARRCRRVRELMVGHGRERRVRWLGIASGLWATQDDLRDYRDAWRVPVPLTLDADDSLFRRFGVRSLPAVVVLGADGRVARRMEGETLDGGALEALPTLEQRAAR